MKLIFQTRVTISDNLDPWHFSYLGKDYFTNVPETQEFNRLLYCPIKSIYTGKTNAEYRE